MPPETEKISLPFDLEGAKGGMGGELETGQRNSISKGRKSNLSPVIGRKSVAWMCDFRRSGERASLHHRGNGSAQVHWGPDRRSLLNLRLTNELMLAKELEAFQTMSTFFVHDLKNATSTLSLTLQNLPVHFDDPEFREDALRGIANTVNRINMHIGRLSVLRNKLELKPIESDLNQLVIETLENLNGIPGVELVKELHPLPKVVVDREQLQNVVTNLLLNARDAVGMDGQIRVETSQCEGRALLSVADNGCGMSPDFLRDSLFRPFQTTKKKGLGIGMFQSKMIVEAHRGNIQVESEPGKGTKFGVFLPLAAKMLMADG